jgi:hypothetical protein
MNKDDLRDRLRSHQVNELLYSLDGGSGPDTVILDQSRSGTWYVYYSERGKRSFERTFAVEAEACEYFMDLLRSSLGPRFPGSDPQERGHMTNEERTSGNLSLVQGTLILQWPDGSQETIDLDGVAAVDVVSFPQGAVVLLDSGSGTGRVANLVGVSAEGTVIWRAAPPTDEPTDAFVSAKVSQSGQLLASTWTGYQAKVDPRSGHAVLLGFTK